MNDIRASFEKWLDETEIEGLFTLRALRQAYQAAWQARQGDLKIATDALQKVRERLPTFSDDKKRLINTDILFIIEQALSQIQQEKV